jgi:hypothetical protein
MVISARFHLELKTQAARQKGRSVVQIHTWMVNVPNEEVNLEGLKVCDYELVVVWFLCG